MSRGEDDDDDYSKASISDDEDDGSLQNSKEPINNNPFSKLEIKMKVAARNDTDSDKDDDDDEDEEDEEDEDEMMDDEEEFNDGEEDDEEDEDEEEDDAQKKLVSKFFVDDDDDNDINEEDEDENKEKDETLLKSHILEQKEYMKMFHPECQSVSFEEVSALSVVIRNEEGIIVDQLHRTSPLLTKYEKARIIGTRTQHLDDGDEPYISDIRLIAGKPNSEIAVLEMNMKLLPYIIRRPFPNGKFEYWKLSDLVIL
jgi:DNA-directed RNA polymerase subunit K/omega